MRALAAVLLLISPALRADDDEAPPADDPPAIDAPAPEQAAPEPPRAKPRQRPAPSPKTSGGGGGSGGSSAALQNGPRNDDFGSNPAGALGDKANFVDGIMFVGFSPQDHPNGGAGTPKYDAYNYLVINKVDPNDKTWAPRAAAGLNKKYPCKYWAQDGETLIYEDEYIHSAPPGHGVPGGAIPGARGEFIWGGMNGYVPPGNPCGGASGHIGGGNGEGSRGPGSAGSTSGSGSGSGAPAGAGVKKGELDLKTAYVLNNPKGMAEWPITTKITALEIRPNGVHLEFSKREGSGRWPDVTPPGWDGPLQYTLGAAEYIDGKWYASAVIQFWHGLEESGGPIRDLRKNWFYAEDRWGPLSKRQPVPGSTVGFFVVAGNVRNVTDEGSQSPRKERSNVVLVTIPGPQGARFVFDK